MLNANYINYEMELALKLLGMVLQTGESEKSEKIDALTRATYRVLSTARDNIQKQEGGVHNG